MNRTATRISRTIAVAAAGVAVGLATTIAVASGGNSDRSPGSYHPAERAAVADWAVEHHLTGLSPASLTSTESAAYDWTPRLAAEMKAIADYAREHQLSGLSPASLQPMEPQP
jgi:hypothetical protein